ncbi:O-antigen ligase family protein [Pseudarthrobacter sulfonivorans]|uniref:O-antigen ligase family protein n=1 Tax=Pseudarthrobacter sulfonivorans TaxID=121292 RepID=UPI002864B440|nr:O-antigen ligase family protein [Pseudarthrobacter sulfonivorans]MDR6414012.1 O-antigen ligase [Pseudarthrobacter sulfonivorans]
MGTNSRGAAGRRTRWAAGLPAASIALVAASVLAFQPGGLFRFVWVKLLILLAALVCAALSPGAARLPRGVTLTVGAGAAWIAVTMLLSAAPLASIAGRWPRYEGILTIGVYIALFAAGARLLGGDGAGEAWGRLRLSLAIVAMVLVVISGLEAAGLRPLGGVEDARPGATLGNATEQGLIGLVIAGVISAFPREPGPLQRWIARAGFLAALAVVVLSGSRAALMGAAMVVVVASVLWLKNRPGRARWSLGAATAVAALAAFTGAAVLIPATRTRLFSAETVDGRWMLWERTWALVQERLWFGAGPSGFVDVLPGYLDRLWSERTGDGFPTDSPHNLPLQLLAAGGVPLLLIAAVFACLFFKSALAKIRDCHEVPQRRQLIVALAAVTAYALAVLTHFTSPGTTALVAFICGGLVGVELQRRAQSGVPPVAWAARRRAAALVLAVAALAVVVPAAAAEWPMANGARAARLGDIAGAEASFQTALRLRPWDSDVSLLAAQAFAGPATGGNTEAALAAVKWGDQALEATPHSLEAGIAAAIGCIYSGSLSEAKTRLDGLAKLAPFSAGVYVHRGVANFGLGNAGEGIADLHVAASLEPSSDTPWLLLAGIYERLGDGENSRQALLRARELAAG